MMWMCTLTKVVIALEVYVAASIEDRICTYFHFIVAIAESPLGLNLSARPGHAPGFVQQVKSPREGTSTFRELTETTEIAVKVRFVSSFFWFLLLFGGFLN